MVAHGVGVNLTGTAFLGANTTGEIAKMIGQQGDVCVQGLTNGLTVFPGLYIGEGFKVRLNPVGYF